MSLADCGLWGTGIMTESLSLVTSKLFVTVAVLATRDHPGRLRGWPRGARRVWLAGHLRLPHKALRTGALGHVGHGVTESTLTAMVSQPARIFTLSTDTSLSRGAVCV